MQHDFTNLRHALQDLADGTHALARMRALLIEALRDWPGQNYQTADYLLPWGQLITKPSRDVIGVLLVDIDSSAISAKTNIFNLAQMYKLILT